MLVMVSGRTIVSIQPIAHRPAPRPCKWRGAVVVRIAPCLEAPMRARKVQVKPDPERVGGRRRSRRGRRSCRNGVHYWSSCFNSSRFSRVTDASASGRQCVLTRTLGAPQAGVQGTARALRRIGQATRVRDYSSAVPRRCSSRVCRLRKAICSGSLRAPATAA